MGWSLALSFTKGKALVAGSVYRRMSPFFSWGGGAEYASRKNAPDFDGLDRILPARRGLAAIFPDEALDGRTPQLFSRTSRSRGSKRLPFKEENTPNGGMVREPPASYGELPLKPTGDGRGAVLPEN
jgi:hypothetical protein